MISALFSGGWNPSFIAIKLKKNVKGLLVKIISLTKKDCLSTGGEGAGMYFSDLKLLAVEESSCVDRQAGLLVSCLRLMAACL